MFSIFDQLNLMLVYLVSRVSSYLLNIPILKDLRVKKHKAKFTLNFHFINTITLPIHLS